jgi:hypothetical protein
MNKLRMMVCTYHLSYVESHGEEDHGVRWILGKNVRLYLKNKESKNGWEHDSSGRVLV